MQRLLNAALILSGLLTATTSQAIVLRHDVLDSSYINLGNQFPQAVWINGPLEFGSGTLIAPNWVLTAAHVVDDGFGNVMPANQWANVEIDNGSEYGLGQFMLNGVGVQNIIFNNWGGPGTRDGRDIALIQLTKPVTITPMFRNSSSVDSLLGQNVTIVGYGRTGNGNTGGVTPDRRKRGQNNVIDVKGPAENPLFNNNIVLSDFDCPAGTCNRYGNASAPRALEGSATQGDSGGPWILGGKIAAISSFAQTDNNLIAGFYGYYVGATAVSLHNNWINEVMGGVNWNVRGEANFDDGDAWGDGRVPTSQDVRFGLPTDSSVGIPEVELTTNRAVHNVNVEYGLHRFRIGDTRRLISTGQFVVDKGGSLSLLSGTINATRQFIVGNTFDSAHETNGYFNMTMGTKLIVASDTPTSLIIGHNGYGGFLQAGGVLEVSTRSYVGNLPGSQGRYEFSGGNATFEDDVFVGNQGTGTINQIGAAQDEIEIKGDLYIGYQRDTSGAFQSQGYYSIGGGTLTVEHSVDVGNAGVGQFTQTAGTVRIGDNLSIGKLANSVGIYKLEGGILDVSSGSIELGLGTYAEFNLLGGKLHVGTYNGDLVNSGGSLDPKDENSIGGLTTITGDYTQSAGSLDIEIGEVFDSTIRGVTYDALDVGGLATLSGLLRPSLLDGFVPEPTDTFNILDAASLVGAFANELPGNRIPTDDGSGTFLVTYDLGQVILSDFLAAPSGLPGDFDLDGDFDGRDFLTWQRNPSVGDLADWQEGYGEPPVTASHAVPEPGSLMLVCGVVMVMPARRCCATPRG